MRTTTLAGILLALLFGTGVLPACSGSSSDDGANGSVDAIDAVPEVRSDVVLRDVAPDSGPGVEDLRFHKPDGQGSGGFGDPCNDNGDCESGWCIPYDEGFVCTELCLTSQGCENGWNCRGLPQTAPDTIFVCVPQNSHLCQPCVADFECEGGYCLPVAATGDTYCTRPCNEELGCPDGFACEASRSLVTGVLADMCIPVTGRCDCTADNQGQARACSFSNDTGTCWGVEACDAELGWTGCSASVPAPEDCNGLDDDCNGLPDDQPVPPAQPCERAVEGVGTCAGQWFCRGLDGWFCSAAEPGVEICDYQDNDCDDAIDEDFVDAATGLYVDDANCGGCGNDCSSRFPHATATCQAGTASEADCVVADCDPGYYRANDFACLPVTSSLCLACVSDATCIVPGDRCLPVGEGYFCGRNCAAGSLYGEICPDGYECVSPLPAEPSVRQCLPVSGSCGCTAANAGAEKSCTYANAFGTCFGLQECDPTTGWSPCSAIAPTAETCDGLDNDCDGLVDEQLVPPEEICRTEWSDPETGETAYCEGAWACRRDDDATAWECLAAQAGLEVCDYLDNDCDGLTDEGFRDDETGQYTAVESCGLCGFSCEGSILFATEVACDASLGTPRCIAETCADGYYRPEGNETVCIPVGQVEDCTPCGNDSQCAALPGTCFPMDNSRHCLRTCAVAGDCPDGYGCQEGLCFPASGSCTCRLELHVGTSRTCFRQNLYGVCVGTQACALGSGWSTCTARQPAPEACDGIDNDCDGQVDEGVQGVGQSCQVTNGFGTCSGTRRCGAAPGSTAVSIFCSAPEPAPEDCDYVDDDCDGQTDEDFKDAAAGVYADPLHCGACGASCVDRIPNATATCAVDEGVARCVVQACDRGYYPIDDLSCLPILDSTCRPCETDADCPVPGDACVRNDDGLFCGRDCSAGNAYEAPAGQCPEGYACQEFGAGVEQCVPVTGSCGCLPGDEGARRVCLNENGFGTCYGAQTCDPAAGWSDCSARIPAEEVCNGFDDDCNGLADDAALLGEGCFREAQVDGQTFLCTGAYVCTGDASAPQCSAKTPARETCNYDDDDCDGETDETFPTLYETCSVGVGACRRFGYVECTDDGSAAVCNAREGGFVAEVCNGVDDDCDGLTDEEWPDVGEVCIAGTGVCERFGIKQCNPADPVGPTRCDAAAGQGGGEICNGGDDDCDGETDEEWPELGTVCITGRGICERAGVYHCDANDRTQSACSVEPGPANPVEQCDGLDDDCDGQTDESWPEIGTVCVVGDGICERAGVYRCDADDASRSRCSVDPGTPSPVETCDGLDDDCDGQTDESWPTLGETCTVGYGICVRAGVFVCDATSPLGDAVCSATPGTANPLETCDYQDDDCDGQTDEGFLDDTGRYASPDHCGACNNRCEDYWSPSPAVYHLNPVCATSGPYPACGYICFNGFVDADGIPENGCELEIDPGAVYVATPRNGGADNGACGAYSTPCATIGWALDLAETLSRPRVLVSDGLYTEQVVLRPGISLLGGYNHRNWDRDWTVNVTILQGNPFVPEPNPRTVVAERITATTGGGEVTRFEGFTVQGLLAFLASTNSYAIYVKDCDSTLEIANNTVFGGNGGIGMPGTDGPNGELGVDGTVGLAAHNAAAPNCRGNPGSGYSGFFGGPGGQRICLDPGEGGPTTAVSGGDGGWVTCPRLQQSAADGLPGLGATPGSGGDGGWDSQQNTSIGGCTVSGSSAFHFPGDDGLRGEPGSSGTGGAGADVATGVVDAGGHWLGAAGTDGLHGSHGSGGGGGGGGGGCDIGGTTEDFGATGGGGGSGGCAGFAGYRGRAGGGSFGVFVTFDTLTPTDETDVPVIEGNTLWRGRGGAGGYGGNGGSGGDGGRGGRGGNIGTISWRVFCVAVGGQGGGGGRGGHGGGGGGGAGGASFDIFGWGFNGVTTSYLDDNAFQHEDTYWTGGVGGSPGNSANTTTGVGAAGVDGASGRLHVED